MKRMEKTLKQSRRWWQVPLLLLACLLVGSSPTWADTWHFAGNSEHAVENHPTLAKPYMQFVAMYFDKTSGNNGYFTKTKPTSYASKIPSNAADGPAMFINGEYLCSPIAEFGWNGDGDGAWSACGNDTWWKNTYTRTINGITYTVKFYNPYHVGSTKRMMVNVLIFADKWVAGTQYNVTIAGMFKMNDKQKTPVEESYTWQFNAVPSLGVGSPTAEMVNYTKMKISGNLLSGYGPTTVGSYRGATTSGLAWTDNLTSKASYAKGNASFTNQEVDFSERSNYFNNAAKYMEYIVAINDYTPAGFDEMSPKVSMNYYQWYSTSVPGFVRAKNLKATTNDLWKKEVKLTWDYEGTNTNGKWCIYRSDGTTLQDGIDFGTRNYVVTAPAYATKYTYSVVFIPTGGERRSELTASVDHTLTREWAFTKDAFKASVGSDEASIDLSWAHSAIGDASGTKTYSLIIQRSNDGTQWTDLHTISISSSNTNDGSYTDRQGLIANRTYYYRLKVNVLEADIYSTVVSTKLGGSKILSFTASRGSYSSMVKLQWTVKQVGTNTTNFIIQRRPLNSVDERAWADIYTTSGTAGGYSYDDTEAKPGSFYEYKVIIWSQDGETRSVDDTRTIDGFSLSSGIISGRISYGTGTAVEGAKVTLKRQGNDGSVTSGMHSVKLSGYGAGMRYVADNDELKSLLTGDFSIQMYLNPNSEVMNGDADYRVLDVEWALTISAHYEQAGDRYKLSGYFGGGGFSTDSLYIPAGQWSHLTVVHNKAAQTLTVYVMSPEGKLKSEVVTTGRVTDWSKSGNADCLAIGNVGQFISETWFEGYIDEFRFFTRPLTEADILRNYNHPLAGTESGLAIYYPFDEGLTIQNLAYDFSKTNDISNGRHAQTKVAAASSDYIPGEDQLSLMAYTDTVGNYSVRGVPFSGEGTSYTIIPSLGIHEFSPSIQSRFVSQSSLNHDGVDFEDISSFPVSGKVYYAGTDYPVEGVAFYVDGMPCAKDGAPIKTNEQGEFTISVPIGKHFISVEKSGHVFVDNGRYPADPNNMGEKRNFDGKMTGLVFYDSTLVNLTGRVVGGSIEGDKAIGFGLSKNNIGVAELVLTPQNPLPRLNVYEEKSEGSVSYEVNPDSVPIASATPDIKSKSWRGAGDEAEAKKLYIHTDSLTGEFSAMVPPILYNLGEIKVLKTGTKVSDESTVDLTQPLLNYKDSTENGNGGFKYYQYHTMLRKTYHSEPSFTVVQEGNTDGAFGESSYEVTDLNGTINVTDIYSKDADGKVNYKYGGAIFEKDNPYTFNIEGFEEYKNYDVDAQNPVVSRVPLAETVVTIDNELSSSNSVYIEGNADGAEPGAIAQLQSNQLQLDSLGRATYKWKAGFPNIASPYTRTIAISYEIDNKTYLWNNGKALYGIVLGALPTGNNFVTQGPDMIDMVLRDPPGTKSKAEWTSGTVKSYSHSRGGTWSSDTHIKTKSKLGTTQSSGIGLGVMTIQNLDAKVDLTVGVDVTVEGEDASSWGRTVTATRAISTSDEMEYVGAQGDVFIGSSTNIIYGLARNVDFVRVDATDNVELKLEDVLTTTIGFDTEFAYTQNYIENVLIPNLEKMRDGLLTTVTDTTGFVNTEKEPVYLTLLPSGDERFASSNHDKDAWGSQATDAPSSGGPSYRMYIPDGSTKNYQDRVEWCNNSILNWKNRLCDNEREKVEAAQKAEQDRQDSIKVLNVSFDSGTSVTSTIETENTKGTHYDCNVTSVAVINLEMGCAINNTGVYWDVGTETGGGEHFEDETETTETTSFSYTLQEEGDDDAISVDIYEYGQYGPIFRTRGGQTSAPYEGEVKTKYYEQGQHTIMEATMQIEVPQITVDVPEVSDVPTGGTANYTLRLSNASEIDEDVYYRLLVADETNPDGAILSIDGKVISDNRIIKVPAGETVTKLLQLKQADMSILDYLGNNEESHELYRKGIALVLASQSQYDPTSTWDVIADTVFVKAHFVPSSSPVELALSNTLMNTQTGTDLLLTFSGFDRNYRGLKAFRLQYKKQGSTNWTQVREFVVNKADKTATNDTLPNTGASVSYKLAMKDFADGDYLFRVVSASTYGLDEVYRYSDEIALTKDMARPRPLGQPEPSDGILDIGEELSVTFNEAFLKGELTKEANFKVTGVLNGADIDHNTALSLVGHASQRGSEVGEASGRCSAQTEAGINLAGKDFSIDTWVNITGAGTLLSHGAGTNKLTVGTNDERKLVVTIGDSVYTSIDAVPTDDWSFLSLCYRNAENGSEVSATMASSSDTYHLFSSKPVIAYNGNGPLNVGCGAKAALHELLLWDEAHDMTTALMNRSRTKNPSTRHLIGYWKMNEGEGTTIRDYARSRHMTMPSETWYMNNVNKASTLDGTQYLSVLAADMAIFSDDDYAVEFWVHGDKQTGEAQLLQMGEVALWLNADGQLMLTGKGAYLPTAQQSSIFNVQSSILDNVWHHVALNVLRQGAAAVYVDGKRVLTTTPSNIGSIATDNLLIGVRRTTVTVGEEYSYDRPFNGEIDEVRVWGATMNAEKLAADRKVRLTGSEDGLLAYLPFEKKQLDSGNQVEIVGTFDNLAKNGHEAMLLSLNDQAATASYSDGPAMREKPVETNVNFNYTASDTKVVISIDEDPATIEGCTLNFTVRSLRDENGNYSDPVVWSAFINQKELVWQEGSVSCATSATQGTKVTATIVNKSGKQQMWTLDGMPSWLQASSEYGTTNPLEETVVTFTVSPSTPIGKYEETIYLKGNNGIETPLTINVKVTGDEPLWAVDPGQYEQTMNLIGSLVVIDTPSEDEDDIVAAFIGGECRGVAQPQYLKRYDRYFLTMDIYGNGDDADETVEFKVYDASMGTIYPVVNTSAAVTFEDNKLLGIYGNPVVLTATDEVEQSIDLGKGWNWMSLSVSPDVFTVPVVFAKAGGKVDMVKAQKGVRYYSDGSWAGTLNDMSSDKMYAVKTSDALVLTVTGHRVVTSAVPVTVGSMWNWVGFNASSLMSVTDALAGMEPQNGDIIKAQRGIAYYDNYEWLGSLQTLMPGKGYKIFSASANDRTFSYPNKTATGANARMAQPTLDDQTTNTPNNHFTPVDYREYPSNMVLIAQVVRDGSPIANAELGVFAGEECREAAVTDSQGMVYITIPGDEPVELTFSVAINGHSSLLIPHSSLTYETDAVIGTPRAPFIIDLGQATGIRDNKRETINNKRCYDLQGRRVNSQMMKSSNRQMKGVYIVNGQKEVR